MDEIVALVVEEVVAIVFVFLVLHQDEAWMTEEQRDRAWPTASRRIAAVYFTLLALPLHFLRTRRSWKGLFLGLAWGAALLAADELLGAGLDLLLPHAGAE